MFYVVLLVLFAISFLLALWSLRKELKKSNYYSNKKELVKEQEHYI